MQLAGECVELDREGQLPALRVQVHGPLRAARLEDQRRDGPAPDDALAACAGSGVHRGSVGPGEIPLVLLVRRVLGQAETVDDAAAASGLCRLWACVLRVAGDFEGESLRAQSQGGRRVPLGMCEVILGNNVFVRGAHPRGARARDLGHGDLPRVVVLEDVRAFPFEDPHLARQGELEADEGTHEQQQDAAMGHQHAELLPALPRPDNAAAEQVHEEQRGKQVAPGKRNRQPAEGVMDQEEGVEVLRLRLVEAVFGLIERPEIGEQQQEQEQNTGDPRG